MANEGLLRAIVRLTIEQREKNGAAALRGYRRIAWIESALAPIRSKLGATRFARLVSATSLCLGPEALLVLRDVRALDDHHAVEVGVWSARALLRVARGERRSGVRDRSKR